MNNKRENEKQNTKLKYMKKKMNERKKKQVNVAHNMSIQ